MSVLIHEREQDDTDIERYAKRSKFDEEGSSSTTVELSSIPLDHILPPSHSLLGIPLPVVQEGGALRFLEADVGISEYIGRGEAKVEGIIKQRLVSSYHFKTCVNRRRIRFTDFLVFEVDLDSKVIHLKSLGKPEAPSKNGEEPATTTALLDEDVVMASTTETDAPPAEPPVDEQPSVEEKTANGTATESKAEPKAPEEPWPERFNVSLSDFLDEDGILQVKSMFLEGPEPPRVTDSGWGGRKPTNSMEGDAEVQESASLPESFSGRDSRGGRGKRGARGGGRGGRGGGRGGGRVEDNRRVTSKVNLDGTFAALRY